MTVRGAGGGALPAPCTHTQHLPALIKVSSAPEHLRPCTAQQHEDEKSIQLAVSGAEVAPRRVGGRLQEMRRRLLLGCSPPAVVLLFMPETIIEKHMRVWDVFAVSQMETADLNV